MCFYGFIVLKFLVFFLGFCLDFDMNGKEDDSRGNEKESGVKVVIRVVI